MAVIGNASTLYVHGGHRIFFPALMDFKDIRRQNKQFVAGDEEPIPQYRPAGPCMVTCKEFDGTEAPERKYRSLAMGRRGGSRGTSSAKKLFREAISHSPDRMEMPSVSGGPVRSTSERPRQLSIAVRVTRRSPRPSPRSPLATDHVPSRSISSSSTTLAQQFSKASLADDRVAPEVHFVPAEGE